MWVKHLCGIQRSGRGNSRKVNGRQATVKTSRFVKKIPKTGVMGVLVAVLKTSKMGPTVDRNLRSTVEIGRLAKGDYEGVEPSCRRVVSMWI